MKVTVVGMWNSFPKNNEPASGYLVEKDGTALLIDAGSGIALGVQKYIRIHDLDHIIISHYHHDHAGDIEAFMLARKVASQLKSVDHNLNIYGPESGQIVKMIRRAKYSNFRSISSQRQRTIGPFKIDFHRNEHSIETYAIKLTDDNGATLVYTSDTCYRGSLVRFAFGADLLITDCCLYEGYDGKVEGHMNAEEAGRLASKTDVGRTLLANLPHHGETGVLLDSARQHPANTIRLAEAGMVMEI